MCGVPDFSFQQMKYTNIWKVKGFIVCFYVVFVLLCCEVLWIGHIWRYCLWECCVSGFWFVLCLCFCLCALNQVSRSGVIYGAASCLWQCWLRPSSSFFKPSLTSGVGLKKWKSDNTSEQPFGTNTTTHSDETNTLPSHKTYMFFEILFSVLLKK